MADPATFRPAPGEIPTTPGVYRFRDAHGRVIYVGKAKNLRSRVSSYFQDASGLHPRTAAMVTTAASVDWTMVETEVEALTLEYAWIKEYDPRFNVKYKDDKSYPYLAITLAEAYPRAMVVRGDKRPGIKYFGPYGHVWAIRETLDLLLKVFPVRTCAPGVFRRAASAQRACLLGDIGKCSAPCVERITVAEHRLLAEELARFLDGDTKPFIRRLSQQMAAAAQAQEYEQAASLRDNIEALQRATEKNALVLADDIAADILAFAADELEASMQMFHVRSGRVRGQRGWVVEKVEPLSDAQLIAQLIEETYGGADPEDIPPLILVPIDPDGAADLQQWLSHRRGGRVELKVAQRGPKRDLMATVHRNAEHALALHQARRAGDLTSRSQALQELQDALGMDEAPLRIECFDISTTQGSHQVGSMVVFEDGLARKSEYRQFTIRGDQGHGARDDTAAMHEVISRRFRYLTSQQSTQISSPEAPVTGRSGPATSFTYQPHLAVVDGGAPQVAAAARALQDVGLAEFPVIGLAKRLEEIWLPGEPFPIILPRNSQGLFLLQRIRDEAHRFAITAHRARRSKAMTASVLDEIPGLGPSRIEALLSHFGSVRQLSTATLEQILDVPGVGQRTAETIVQSLERWRESTSPGAGSSATDPREAS